MAARDLSLPSHLQVTPANVTGAGGPGAWAGRYGASSGCARREPEPSGDCHRATTRGRAASSVGSVGEVPPPPGVMRPPPALPRRRPLGFGARAASTSKRTRHAARRAAPQVRHRHKRRHRPAREGAPARRPVQAPRLGRARADRALLPRYGQAEAATMCLAIASGVRTPPRRNRRRVRLRRRRARRDAHRRRRRERRVRSRRLPGGSGSGYVHGYAATIAEKARRALEDPRLTGSRTSTKTAGTPPARRRRRSTWAVPSSSRSSITAACTPRCTPTPRACSRRRGIDRWRCPSRSATRRGGGGGAAARPPAPRRRGGGRRGGERREGRGGGGGGVARGMLRPARGPGAPSRAPSPRTCWRPSSGVSARWMRFCRSGDPASRRRLRRARRRSAARQQRRRLEAVPRGASRGGTRHRRPPRAPSTRDAGDGVAPRRRESDFSRVASWLSEEDPPSCDERRCDASPPPPRARVSPPRWWRR